MQRGTEGTRGGYIEEGEGKTERERGESKGHVSQLDGRGR